MLWERTLSRFALVALATTAFANSVALKKSRQVEDAAEVFEVSAGTLEELAEELCLDFRCLSKANPSKSTLAEHELLQIPLHCCGTRCDGPVCCQRSERNGQTNSVATQIAISNTISCIITNTGSPTSTLSTLATTIVTAMRRSSSVQTTSCSVTGSASGTEYSQSTTSGSSSQTGSLSNTGLLSASGSSSLIVGPSSASTTILPSRSSSSGSSVAQAQPVHLHL